jgi:hypothetical protein
MSVPRAIRTAIVTAVALVSTLFVGSAASAAGTDTTAPTAPQFGYAEGFYCLTLIIGDMHSTDNATPQSQIKFRVYDDGVFIGSLNDNGAGPWAFLALRHSATNMVTVRAVDAAGNVSAPSRQAPIWGYFTPGCTPYHL